MSIDAFTIEGHGHWPLKMVITVSVDGRNVDANRYKRDTTTIVDVVANHVPRGGVPFLALHSFQFHLISLLKLFCPAGFSLSSRLPLRDAFGETGASTGVYEMNYGVLAKTLGAGFYSSPSKLFVVNAGRRKSGAGAKSSLVWPIRALVTHGPAGYRHHRRRSRIAQYHRRINRNGPKGMARFRPARALRPPHRVALHYIALHCIALNCIALTTAQRAPVRTATVRRGHPVASGIVDLTNFF